MTAPLPEPRHVPVMVSECLAFLAPGRGGLFVDATLGLGGHSEAMLEAAPEARVLGIDQDPTALALAVRRLERFGGRFEAVLGSFFSLRDLLEERRIATIAGILADLGVSSLQLDTPERGFSFRFDAPLDMRMGQGGITAADLANEASEGELEKILREYGEERQARRIARAIVRARQQKPLTTTGDLKRVVEAAKGRDWDREGRIDPATRVFQAFRIEVNQELSGLEGFIDQAIEMMEAEGRLVIISYHSLEDRIVKNTLRDSARGEVDQVTGRPRSESQLIEVLTRKPMRPTEEELAVNPRARSARLRAAKRL